MVESRGTEWALIALGVLVAFLMFSAPAWICAFAVLAYFHFWIGNGLRRLDTRVRMVAIVYGSISLLVGAIWFNLLVLLFKAD